MNALLTLVPNALHVTNPKNVARFLLRAAVLLFIAALCLGPVELRDAALASLADAYIQVTIFVATTLFVVYLLEVAFAVDLGALMAKSQRWQPFFAALLGAFPGCGGAIVVMTQYTRGHISFGSVVAVLIATMGDAAFLLLAREPLTGLAVIAISLVTATISGVVIDMWRGRDYMRHTPIAEINECETTFKKLGKFAAFNTTMGKLWLVMLIPGIPLALGGAFQLDTNAWFGTLSVYEPVQWFGVFGALLSIYLWAFRGRMLFETQEEHAHEPMMARLVEDTCFVTAWVVMAFLSFELVTYLIGSGINNWFAVSAPFMPVLALLIGFIPGCGPQIIVTTLYLAGAIPFSAQITNAIANDGDALFPAIALAPRAALYATLYSGFPALIVGYGYFFLFE